MEKNRVLEQSTSDIKVQYAREINDRDLRIIDMERVLF